MNLPPLTPSPVRDRQQPLHAVTQGSSPSWARGHHCLSLSRGSSSPLYQVPVPNSQVRSVGGSGQDVWKPEGASPHPRGCPAAGPALPSAPGLGGRHPGPRILLGAPGHVSASLKIRRRHEHSCPLVPGVGGSGSRCPSGAQTPCLFLRKYLNNRR